MNEQPMSLRDTAKGIGIRAAILGVGGLVVGGWLTAFAMRTAGRIIQLMVGLVLLMLGAGAATWEFKKVQKRLTGQHDTAGAM